MLQSLLNESDLEEDRLGRQGSLGELGPAGGVVASSLDDDSRRVREPLGRGEGAHDASREENESRE